MAAAMALSAHAEGEAAPAAKYLVIEETDWSGKVTLEVKSNADYIELQKDIKLESSLRSRALAAAQSAWRADKELKNTPFPTSAIVTRAAKSLGTFSDKDKAEARKKAIEEERTPKKDDAKGTKKPTKNPPKKDQKQLEAEKKRLEHQREMEMNDMKAVGFFTEKLQELKAAAAKPAEKPAA
jgi:hypothetical protein